MEVLNVFPEKTFASAFPLKNRESMFEIQLKNLGRLFVKFRPI